MVLVVYVFLAWLSIHILLSLPSKLPLCVNMLVFIVIDIVLINKLTILGYNMKLFIMSQQIPSFIALIIHNDVTIPTVLLTFVNVFWTTQSHAIRLAVTLYAILAQLFLGMTLNWFNVLVNNGWDLMRESIMIVLVSLFTLLVGKWLARLAVKEGWVR